MNLELDKNVPHGWRLMRLEEVCHKITDGTHKTPNYQPNGIRFISIKNIRPFQPINWKSYEKYISPAEHRELTKRCKPEYDDILFPRIGTLGFAKRIDFKDEVSIFVGLGLLKPRNEIVRSKFLELWMNTPLIHRLSHERANGSGRLTLPLEESRLFPVLIPPLSEQDGIVSEIEKQLTRLEAGVAGLRRVQTNLQRYRAAVLKAACEGKLVPTEAELARQEGHTYESGAQLLDRILTERREKWNGKRKYKEPVKPDTTNLPPLPAGWAWTTMDAVIILGPQNGIYLPKASYGRGCPILRIDDFQEGWVRDRDKLNMVTADPETLKVYKLRVRDLIINRVNSPSHLGKCLVVQDSLVPAVFESNMMRAVLSSVIHARYVEFYFRSVDGHSRLNSNAKWAVNQASINQQDVKSTALPLPPLPEEQRIVAEVERRLSVVEEIEAVVNANLQRATRLRQSFLQRAFEGGLSERIS